MSEKGTGFFLATAIKSCFCNTAQKDKEVPQNQKRAPVLAYLLSE